MGLIVRNGQLYGQSNVRYNEETDMMQIFYRGKWVDLIDKANLSEDFSLSGLLQLLAEKYFPSTYYLYHEGNECEAITGGWVYTFTGDKTNQKTIVLGDDGMIFTTPLNSSGATGDWISAEKAIDFSNFTKIYIDITVNTAVGSPCIYLFYSSGTDTNTGGYVATNSISSANVVTGRQTIELAIPTNARGIYYFTLRTGINNSLYTLGKVHNIWVA